ncbi:MAG: hypothetical protein KGI33_12320 [Thaumarchaeota archaeon]|nr:hypothetical protein [Nitrososphaerota archaeon]
MKSIPEFEDLTGKAAILPLESFPMNDLPSGGMSTRISPSEMFLVLVESPCPKDSITMTWKDPAGRKISQFTEKGPVVYEFLGRFGWEIKDRGKYTVNVKTSSGYNETINFEVI